MPVHSIDEFSAERISGLAYDLYTNNRLFYSLNKQISNYVDKYIDLLYSSKTKQNTKKIERLSKIITNIGYNLEYMIDNPDMKTKPRNINQLASFVEKHEESTAELSFKDTVYEMMRKKRYSTFTMARDYVVRAISLAKDPAKLQTLNREKQKGHYYVIYQEPILEIETVTVDGKSVIDDAAYSQFSTNEYASAVNSWLSDGSIIKNLSKLLFADNNVQSFAVHSQYISAYHDDDGSEGSVLRYSNDAKNITRSTVDFKIPTPPTSASRGAVMLVGYRALVIYKSETEPEKDTIRKLKAFNPTNKIKYHDLTTASTGNSKLCIYESFLHTSGIKKLNYIRRNDKHNEKISDLLKQEGREIETAVKNGELVNSLELLTKKYNNSVHVFFYQNNPEFVGDNLVLNDKPFIVDNGVTSVLKKEHVAKLSNTKTNCMLYDKKAQHVAPTIWGKIKMSQHAKDKANAKEFKLEPQFLEESSVNQKIQGLLGWDMETFTCEDTDGKSIPFCICVYGVYKKVREEHAFYGLDCKEQFVKYLISISTKKNWTKARPKEAIDNIYLYGFNNKNFDNILIYDEILKHIPYAQILYTDNAIKYIKFDNVTIQDISSFYKDGGLRETAEAFNLEEEKGVYPYTFPNRNNLNYIGEIPDIKYWNSEDDLKEYNKKKDLEFGRLKAQLVNNINNKKYDKNLLAAFENWAQTRARFDLKLYTIKYCVLDAKLAFKLAKAHHMNCSGKINNRYYNVSECPTSANLALKIFTQVFLNDTLTASPENIQKFERFSYKGGRTEVFKKQFISVNGSKLYYYDINSSYPSSMLSKMPFRFLKTRDVEKGTKLTAENIIDYHLYLANSTYVGNNIHNIPNLLIRDDKSKSLYSANNTDYHYHWGIELREAISNGFDICYSEVHEYEGRAIFKEFVEHFYNERLKLKKAKKNEALQIFFKNVLNSLYGKFGQKIFQHTAIIDAENLHKYAKTDTTILTSWTILDNGKFLIKYMQSGDENVSIGTLVRFSSYIAASSRSKLSEIMRDIGHEHIYYCDTDSIFTDKKPSAHFVNDDILGKWKLEDACSSAVFLGKKLYTYTGTFDKPNKKKKGFKSKLIKKSKGINATQIDINEYYDVASGAQTEIKKTRNMFFKSYEGVKIRPQERTVTAIYNKRYFDGNSSRPFENEHIRIKIKKT